ncbi:HET domain-containing protein [Apiospora hydei]|uniref:HET domain-containing protein n=1 Tax=Apiospora hydei TaxID=1337664 RepID=A0ABR1XAK9_9PEZI
MVLVRLQDDPLPDYAALSYVWGDATDTEQITVDDQPFQATKSLASALRQFRSSYITTKDSDRPLLIWADAVCINQQDVTERGQQVSMMGLIYTKACRVISWLGPSEDSTESGFRLIKACARHVEDTRNQEGKYPESDVVMDTQDLAFLGEHGEFHEQNHPRYARNKAWNAIDDLNQHAYWTRIWIVQEVVLARNPEANILHCGGYSMNALGTEAAQATLFDQRVWDWVIKDKGLLSKFIPFAQSLRDPRARGDYRFVSMISTFCRSTDPRDAVFGLNGVLGGEIVPDYTKDPADVFRECVAAVLRQKKYKHFFHSAGLIREGRDVSEFPSWVPRFHTMMEDADYSVGPPDALVAPWLDGLAGPEGPAILGARTMRFSGVRLDRCARVFRHEGPGKAEYPETLTRFWWFCLGFVNSYGGEYPDRDGIRCLEALLSALNKGRDTRGDPLRITSSIHCTAAHAFRLMLRIGEPEDNGFEDTGMKLRALGYLSPEEATAALYDAFVEPGAPEISTLGNTLSEEDYEESFNATNAMFQGVFNWINWPLFRTDKGNMGLAPPAVAEGDLVCLLEGFSIPCLLRRHDQHLYVLVGSCYVNGYSSGEPLESLRKGNLDLEPFYLQ